MRLRSQATSHRPSRVTGSSSTAEVQVHPSGKWLYGSNRGHDSIAVFTIDQKTGKPTLVQNAPTGGGMPRNFRMDPTGRWLIAANMKGNNMTVFKIDQNNNLTVLYSFRWQRDGAFPFAPVTLDPAGNLYGTASQGGNVSCDCGVVFKISPR